MGTTEQGLIRKYEVIKLDNVQKPMDCIVLEFDDPLARIGIKAWAEEAKKRGYEKLHADVERKLKTYEGSK